MSLRLRHMSLSQVAALAAQLAQRAVLYAAQERRWQSDGRAQARAEVLTIREAAKYEGELSALRSQCERQEAALAAASGQLALATERAAGAQATAAAAVRRADAAEREAAALGATGEALETEVARLRVADVGAMESAWAGQLDQLQRAHASERAERLREVEQLGRQLQERGEACEGLRRQAQRWADETEDLRRTNKGLRAAVEAFGVGGRDNAIELLLAQLHAAQELANQRQGPTSAHAAPSTPVALTPAPPASAFPSAFPSTSAQPEGGGHRRLLHALDALSLDAPSLDESTAAAPKARDAATATDETRAETDGRTERELALLAGEVDRLQRYVASLFSVQPRIAPEHFGEHNSRVQEFRHAGVLRAQGGRGAAAAAGGGEGGECACAPSCAGALR
jgi:hypothetical protein